MLDSTNLFDTDVPMKKIVTDVPMKKKKRSPSPSEHFEISVLNPPMHEVNGNLMDGSGKFFLKMRPVDMN